MSNNNPAVDDALAVLIQDELDRKDFQTGSKGFHCQGKIADGDDESQASAQLVLVGSKSDPEIEFRATVEQAVGALAELMKAGVPAKDFGTGKTGYYAGGKVPIGEERYQAAVQAVLLPAR